MNDLGVFDPVLVTGAAGFIGAGAVQELLKRGHQVHVLLRSQSNPWRLQTVMNRLNVHYGDLTDAAVAQRMLHVIRPRVVLHLATHGAYESQADARLILQTS